MCMALPSRVESIEGQTAIVDSAGQRRQVSLILLEDELRVGDYVLVQNGHFAFERLDPEAAREALALIDEIVALSADSDVRAW